MYKTYSRETNLGKDCCLALKTPIVQNHHSPDKSMEEIIWGEINQTEIHAEVFKGDNLQIITKKCSEDELVSHYLGFFNDFFEGNAFPSAYINKLKMFNRWDTPPGTYIRGENLCHSVRYLTKIPIEFYKDLDLAIAASGVSPSKLKELHDNLFIKGYEYEGRYEEERKLLLPVFIEMRKLGYSSTDLMSYGPRVEPSINPILSTLNLKGLTSLS